MIKKILKALLPKFIWEKLRRNKRKLSRVLLKTLIKDSLTHPLLLRKILAECGLNISLVSDYYSPLPVVSKLKKNINRWFKPSKLVGIQYNIEEMKSLLIKLISEYSLEYSQIPSYKENKKMGYGPGYTALDAMLLYFIVRDIKPKRYIEIGSGLSTYYCWLAAKQNEKNGKPVKIACIEPYPYKALYKIPRIKIIKNEVQDIGMSTFEQLEAGGVPNILRTHSEKNGL